ncbi:hypothetical protein TNCV_2667701 [Trichonephila clavipes]|nr:hypothetical protein TNCV_2667701 [Trichonephila clavipes]
MWFPRLPFLSKLAFRNQERKLLKATERVAQENINAALSEIKGSNSFTKCGISIDGTWQRRGYSSLNGCCPEGSESWCRYQRAKAAGRPLKEIEQGLPKKIINQIKPTYLKLCNETLLKKCLHDTWGCAIGKREKKGARYHRFVLARDPINLEESISAALIEEQNVKLNQIANDRERVCRPHKRKHQSFRR